MTNLLFSIVVTLVTNTAETVQYPYGMGHGTVGPHGEMYANWVQEQDKTKDPLTKTVVRTVDWVTNVVRDGVGTFEIGRCRKDTMTTHYSYVIRKDWVLALQTTNGPDVPLFLYVTNGIPYKSLTNYAMTNILEGLKGKEVSICVSNLGPPIVVHWDEAVARQWIHPRTNIFMGSNSVTWTNASEFQPALDTNTGKTVWVDKNGMVRTNPLVNMIGPAKASQRIVVTNTSPFGSRR
jgi:hypothetical protein